MRNWLKNSIYLQGGFDLGKTKLFPINEHTIIIYDMRNRIILLFTLLGFVCCGNNDIPVPEIMFGGLNGNVSLTKDSDYNAVEKFGEPVPTDLHSVFVTEYDKDGHEIKFCQYDEDGDFILRIENVFEEGLVVSESHELSFCEGKYSRTVVERKKNYIKWQEHTFDGSESFSECFYNGLHLTTKDDTGLVSQQTDYDKAGRELESRDYRDGMLSARTLREYDNKGNMTKMVQYQGNDEPKTTTYQYKDYDKKGNWTTKYIYDNGKLEGIIKREITYR